MNNPEIIIAETNPKQAVYIYGCKNSTVQVTHPSGPAASEMKPYAIKSRSQVAHMHATRLDAQTTSIHQASKGDELVENGSAAGMTSSGLF